MKLAIKLNIHNIKVEVRLLDQTKGSREEKLREGNTEDREDQGILQISENAPL